MREAACDICDRSRPPNHMEGWTVPNIWLDPEFGATFTANLLKGTQAILSWFLVLCFPELQFRIVWFSTISVIHHYHLQITGYWVYKLQNHLKSQFLYLSDYDNNHFCSICQCRRHRFDSWSGKISHAADQLKPELQLLSLCSRAHDPQQLKPLCPRTRALQQKKSQQGEACAVQLYSSPCSLQLEKASTATKNQTPKNLLIFTSF